MITNEAQDAFIPTAGSAIVSESRAHGICFRAKHTNDRAMPPVHKAIAAQERGLML
jgi:hypothetical protein